MISYWGVDHGDVVSKGALVHAPGAKKPPLVGKIVRHKGRRATFGRTGPRSNTGTAREKIGQQARKVANSDGLLEGRYKWKTAGTVAGVSGGLGAAAGHQNAKVNQNRKRKIKPSPGGAAHTAGTLSSVGSLYFGSSAGATLAAYPMGAAAGSAGYAASRKLSEKYYKNKKK